MIVTAFVRFSDEPTTDVSWVVSATLALLHGDVLPDEARDLMRLVGLEARDTLLHQVATLHVQEQDAILRLHLACGDHLGERVVHQRLLQIQFGNMTEHILNKDLSLGVHRGEGLDLLPASLHHVDPLRRFDVTYGEGGTRQQELGLLHGGHLDFNVCPNAIKCLTTSSWSSCSPGMTIWRHLVEDDLHVERRVEAHGEVPDGAAEDEVEDLLVLVQLRRHVQHVLLARQRHPHEVCGQDAEEPPAALTRVRVVRLVVCRLLHDLAVDLVTQRLVLVAVLPTVAISP
ncbi:hypothetical protein B566_EDAN011114 [Ephemera danica]|nr:hypothetical protein B566_EDAN011114 [Ephemera danica]